MDVVCGVDENASESSYQVLTADSKQRSSKSPLKPINDQNRLLGKVTLKKVNKDDQSDLTTPLNSPFTHIRLLDSAERWLERTSVVTKEDHRQNCENAKDILLSLIDSLPIDNHTNAWISEATVQKTSICPKLKDASSPPNASIDIDELAELLNDLHVVPKSLPVGDNCDSDDREIMKRKSLEKKGSEIELRAASVSVLKDTSIRGEELPAIEDPFQPRKQIINSPETSAPVSVKISDSSNMNETSLALQLQPGNSPVVPLKHEVNSKKKDEEAMRKNNVDPFVTKPLLSNSSSCVDESTFTNLNTVEQMESFPSISALKKNMGTTSNDNKTPEELVMATFELSKSPAVIDKMSCRNYKESNTVECLDDDHSVSSITPKESKYPENQEVDTMTPNLVKDSTQYEKKGADSSEPFKVNSPLESSPVMPRKGAMTEQIYTLEDDQKIPMNIQSSVSTTPQAERKALVHEEALDCEIDPFKTSNQLANSPTSPVVFTNKEMKDGNLEGDPFTCRKQLSNSPSVIMEQDHTNSNEVMDETKSIHKITDGKSTNAPSSNASPGSISPVTATPQAERKALVHEEALDCEIDPFKTSNQLANSPTSPVVFTNKEMKDGNLDGDPFTCRKQLSNSPPVMMEQDHMNSKEILDETKSIHKITDGKSTNALSSNASPGSISPVTATPQAERKALVHEEALDCEIDPFKTSNQLANSPTSPVVFTNKEMKDGNLEGDPFTCRKQLSNSPSVIMEQDHTNSNEVMDETKSIHKITDGKSTNAPSSNASPGSISPVTATPQAERKALVHEEALDCEIDPFKTSNQLANSPTSPVVFTNKEMKDGNLDGDPFTCRKQLSNSPPVMMEQDHTNSKEILDETKSIHKITDGKSTNALSSNASPGSISPVTATPQAERKALVHEEVQDCEIDPFKTSNQLANSPTSTSPVVFTNKEMKDGNLEGDPFTCRKQLSNSPPVMMEQDHTNSDKVMDETKSIHKITDGKSTNAPSSNASPGSISPVTATPQAERKALVHEEVQDCEIDPFKTSNQLANSPTSTSPVVFTNKEMKDGNLEGDPFTCRKQLSSSPPVMMEQDHTNSNEVMDESKSIHKITDGKSTNALSSNASPGTISNTMRNDDLDIDPIKIVHADDKSYSNESVKIITKTSDSASSDILVPNSQVGEGKQECVFQEEIDNDKDLAALCTDTAFTATAKQATSPVKGSDHLVQSDSPQHEMSTTLVKDVLTDRVSPKKNDILPLANTSEKDLTEESTKRPLVKSSVQFPKLLESSARNDEGCSNNNHLDMNNKMKARDDAKQTGQNLNSNNEENRSSVPPLEVEDEDFTPATEAFNDPSFYDMLEKVQNISSTNNKRGSVLMKFDPLLERSASPAKPLKESRDTFKAPFAVQSTDDSLCLFGTPPRVTRRRTITRHVHDSRVMSIVEESPARINLLDSEDCDAMASFVHENLLPDQMEADKLVNFDDMPKYTERDMKKMRKELTMQFQENILKKDQQFQERLQKQMEAKDMQYEELQQDKEQLKAEVDKLSNKVKSLQEKRKGLARVMEEYDTFISELENGRKQIADDRNRVQLENKKLLEDNKDLEKSFESLMHRYDKLKKVLEQAAEDEKQLKQTAEKAYEKYKTAMENCKKIKTTAETKITELETKLKKTESSSKTEISRLEVALKRKGMDVESLEATLEQKTKQNQELTDLCDSLINKAA